MKHLLLLLTLTLCGVWTASAQRSQQIKSSRIQDAVAKEWVNCKLSGGWEDERPGFQASGYYGQCMRLVIENKRDIACKILVPNGLMLMGDDGGVQDMIVTKPSQIALPPLGKDTLGIYAMCTEMHDGGPSSATSYTIGEMATHKLVSISQAIREMNKHNIAGQGAVWAYTDRATKADLREHGATNSSIRTSIAILNRAGVVTRLNPAPKPDTIVPPPTAPVLEAPAPAPVLVMESQPEPSYTYLAIGGVAAGVVLMGGAGFLVLRRGRRQGEDAPTA